MEQRSASTLRLIGGFDAVQAKRDADLEAQLNAYNSAYREFFEGMIESFKSLEQ